MTKHHKKVFALRHLENGMYISAHRNGLDYVMCFSDHAAAVDFRNELNATEHCEIVPSPISTSGDGRMWLDGTFVDDKKTTERLKSCPDDQLKNVRIK